MLRGLILLINFVFVKVLDWIENHGEAFLSKHTGVGKSLHRARALQKRHEDFEEVAQVRFKCRHTFCRDMISRTFFGKILTIDH